MPEQELPEHLKRTFQVETVAEMWFKLLTEGNQQIRRMRPINSRLPSNPRCVNCHRPFAGVGGAVMRTAFGLRKSAKNPRFCTDCHGFTERFPGGAEIVLTMLFVDVRGSTTIAEGMDPTQFSQLMNRFYEAAITILVRADAFIDKLVGDEVTALFIPGYAGPDHARKAVDAGRRLLQVTGHGDPDGPWAPVGVGIHTGQAWVGSIAGASGAAADFTALGDNVNIAARLASNARQGEVVFSEATYEAAGAGDESLEIRDLELKGKSEPVRVRVLKAD
ncbi:MAG: adenylate/guanylate cyclase domain-containing protein [Anaerolineales bacterium]|nr:adenylate/guanylate cyclase domain-containing protein [Anaerolineales bacterium]